MKIEFTRPQLLITSVASGLSIILIGTLATHLINLHNSIDRLREENSKLIADISKKNEEIKSLNTNISSLKESIESSSKERTELRENLIRETERSKAQKAAAERAERESRINKQKIDIATIRSNGRYTMAYLYKPPSNIRETPNGEILATVRYQTYIPIYGTYRDRWYVTEWNGMPAVIHDSQFSIPLD